MTSPIKINVHLDRIRENLIKLREIAPECKCFAVLKANGYGLGAVPIYHAIEDLVDAICIAIPEEAKALIDGGCKKPILCFGYFPKSFWSYYLDQKIRPAISSIEQAREMNAYAKERNDYFCVHLAFDTGHSRLGFMWNDPLLKEKLEEIMQMKHIKVKGSYSHLACAEERENPLTSLQIERFQKILSIEEIDFGIRHLANDPGYVLYPESRLDGFRTGVCLHGIYPSPEIKPLFPFPLKLALSWETVVIHAKEIPPSTPVSYGATWVSKRTTLVATIQIGYADGYPRQLSNKGRVKIHGVLCPIIGRICMDQMMVDATGLPVKAGDKVILMDEEIDLDDMAQRANTIPCDIITSINPRIIRGYSYRQTTSSS